MPNIWTYSLGHSSLHLRVYLNVFKCYQSFCHNGKEWWGSESLDLHLHLQNKCNSIVYFFFDSGPGNPPGCTAYPTASWYKRPALIPAEWYDREHARHVAPRRPMQPKPGPKPTTPGEAWYGPQAMKRCASTPLYQACDNSCIAVSWESAKVGKFVL